MKPNVSTSIRRNISFHRYSRPRDLVDVREFGRFGMVYFTTENKHNPHETPDLNSP